MIELRPCPFCEGRAKLTGNDECVGHGAFESFSYVMCTNCGAQGSSYSNWEISNRELRESFARRAWNRRAEDDED